MPRAQTVEEASTACCGEEAPRQMEFPYCSLRDGFNSTVLLVSASPKPLDFVLAVRSRSGRTVLAPTMTIQPQEKLPVDLGQLLASQGADISDDFSEGSVAVYFNGTIMPLAGQLTMTNPAKSLSLESEMVDNSPGLGLLPKFLNAVWWGLGGGREARIMVTNTTDTEVTADVFLDAGGKRQESAPLEFSPHETKVLSIVEMLGDLKISPAQAPEGGITIIPRGTLGTLIAQGKITDPATGFSTSLNFPLPDQQLVSALHASGLPIGTPSQDSPFAGTGTFIPHVILRNLLGTAQTATITVEYPGAEGPAQTVLAPLPLGPYSTQDVSLDSAFGLLPLPFCSIRIQYSGPPGSAIAEISSIEQKGDLVIDSRVTNEADWLGMSGAHPWHLDADTDSVLILTNMGDRECRMGFQVQAGGVHYHLVDLKLAAHEIRAIDIRKLRDAQKPDFQGNVIPAAATDGSVVWARMEDVPVTGRLVVLQRRKAIASNYTCGTGCPCPTNFVSLVVTCQGDPILVAQTDQHFSTETRRDCNQLPFYFDVTGSSSWTSSFPAIAIVNNSTHKGLATGVSGGTTTVVAQFSTTNYYYVPYSGCHTQVVNGAGNRSCPVVQVTGPQEVWWFDGQTPSGYATTITLTALPSGATSYSWSLLAGTDKAALQNQSGNTIELIGNDLSTALNDVTVQAAVTIAGGTKHATRTATVRGPKKLVPLTPAYNDTADPNRGFATYARYLIQDNLGTTLPSNVPVSEEWTSSVTWDPPYSGSNSNWVRSDPNGATVAPTLLQDLMSGPLLSGSPVPAATAPSGSNTKVFHWGQGWRIGSTTPQVGAPVQTNTQQFYIDHGRHLNIVSPVP